jgi:hypothetical protein
MRHYFGRRHKHKGEDSRRRMDYPSRRRRRRRRRRRVKGDLLEKAIKRRAYEYELCSEGVKTAPYIQKPKKYKNILVSPSALRDAKRLKRSRRRAERRKAIGQKVKGMAFQEYEILRKKISYKNQKEI